MIICYNRLSNLFLNFFIASSSSMMTNPDPMTNGYTFKFVLCFFSLIVFICAIVKLFRCFLFLPFNNILLAPCCNLSAISRDIRPKSKSFCIKSPILSKKGKNLIEQYQKNNIKTLQLGRNEAKDRMYKSTAKIKHLSNCLKHKILDQDYETIIDVTDKTKEKHYIKKKAHLHSKFNSLKNAKLT